MEADGGGTAADPMVDAVVGGYRIRRQLGEGGMGRVYAAEDERTGFLVAIKVIAEEHAGSPALVERFFAEARAVNLIAHENIVAVHDLARLPDGRPYIVMDLLEGRTARAILRTRRLPLGAVIHVINDVLGALSAAHAVGVVHRDLKPDNVLVDGTGRATLLDFGIAKLVGDNVGAPLARTRTGALLGTPEYMAPEQIECDGVDGRTDLYAVGVLAFELIAGSRPFDGASDFEIMRAHVDDPVPDLRALRPDLPVEVASVVVTALAKAPPARFQSARAMAVALHHAARMLPDDAWGPLLAGGPPRGRAALVLPRDSPTEEALRPGDTFQTRGERIGEEVSGAAITRASRPAPWPGPAAPASTPPAGAPSASTPTRTAAPTPSAARGTAPVPSSPRARARWGPRARVLVPLIARGTLTATVALLVAARASGGAAPAPTLRVSAGGPPPTSSVDAAPADGPVVAMSPPSDAAIDAAAAATPLRAEHRAHPVDAGAARVPVRDAAVVASRVEIDAGGTPAVAPVAAVAAVAPPSGAGSAAPKPARVQRTLHGFDAVGGLSVVTDLARELVPDAELTAAKFWGVMVDGASVSAEYRFRSPHARDGAPCAVRVSLSPRWEERRDPNGLRTLVAEAKRPRRQVARSAIEARAAALRAEHGAKLRDLAGRYTLRVRIEPVALAAIAMRVGEIRIRLRRRKGERALVLHVPPGARAPDARACATCSGTTLAPLLCDDALHVLCETCVPEVGGRPRAAACRPGGTGSPSATRST